MNNAIIANHCASLNYRVGLYSHTFSDPHVRSKHHSWPDADTLRHRHGVMDHRSGVDARPTVVMRIGIVILLPNESLCQLNVRRDDDSCILVADLWREFGSRHHRRWIAVIKHFQTGFVVAEYEVAGPVIIDGRKTCDLHVLVNAIGNQFREVPLQF